jgi:CTP:molybdopterin cytidylyltransferase MocA
VSVLGIVLAAGASQRAGGPKALACLRGEPLVLHAIRLVREAGAREVVVVVAAPWGTAVAEIARRHGATPIHHTHPEQGMLSSLQRALSFGTTHEAALVALVDHPRVRVETARTLVATWRRSRAPLVRPRHGDRRGHPYVIDARVFPALLELASSASPRPLFDALVGARTIDVDDPGVLDDLDTSRALHDVGARLPVTSPVSARVTVDAALTARAWISHPSLPSARVP